MLPTFIVSADKQFHLVINGKVCQRLETLPYEYILAEVPIVYVDEPTEAEQWEMEREEYEQQIGYEKQVPYESTPEYVNQRIVDRI
jgi:hypothetical protein